jgi:transcriptional regulator with XRE-family HTH domain
MTTLGERIKFIQKASGKNQTEFAKSLSISKGSLILYQKNRRNPDSALLKSLCELYKVNATWLLLGEGEAVSVDIAAVRLEDGRVLDQDPVAMLLKEEAERAGLTLSPEQRAAILKILPELVYRDVRAIQELLRSIPGAKN